MGKGLFEEFRGLVGQADEVLGYSIERLCLDDPDGLLGRTEYAQPALYVTNALYHQRELGRGPLRPDYLLGHSLGEYNALLAAGVFDFATGLRLVKRRAELMGWADGGAMAAVVGAPEGAIVRALAEGGASGVVIANYNAPRQFVLSGDKKELERLKPIFEASGDVKGFVMLRTSGAFHSPHMAAARREFEAFLRRFDFAEPATPVVSNVTARPYERGAVAALLAEQITSPVRWTDGVDYARRAGVTSFVELGEGKVLTGLVEKIAAEGAPAGRPESEGEGGAPVLKKIAERCAALADKTLQIYHYDDRVESFTGAQFAARVDALGSALADAMGPQEKAVLFFPQGANFVITTLACWRANVVAIPTPVTGPAQFEQKAAIIRSILESSGAKFLLCDGALRHEVARLAERHGLTLIDVSAEGAGAGAPRPARPAGGKDLALVLYTSGSTAQPKGVMLDHAALFDIAFAKQWCVSEESRMVTWLPQFHAFAVVYAILPPLVHGALCVTHSPEGFVRDPVSWFELIDRYRATHSGAPNFAFDYCSTAIGEVAPSRLSLASLESIVCAGDIINQQHYETFVARFAPWGLRPDVMAPMYGMSEAAPISMKMIGEPNTHLAFDKKALERRRLEPAAPGAPARVVVGCGKPDAVTRVLVIDPETCEPCRPDEVGEIWVKMPRQARGYLNNAEATRRSFDGVVKTTGEGGFLRTGDLGFIVDGVVYVIGREKDVIVVNGKKYDSVDVELTLQGELGAHPLTLDSANGARLPCAAFSYRDGGRERVVVVQEVGGAPAERACAELSSAVVGAVSEKFQLEVSDVVLVPKGGIPVTGSKKIRRKICQEQFISGTLSLVWHEDRKRPAPRREAAPAPGREGLVDAVRQKVLLPEVGAAALELDPQRPFSQLGLDSIRYIRLARKVEAVFGVPFTPDMLYTYDTCEALAGYVAARGGPGRGERRPERWKEYRDERVSSILRDCVRGAVTVEKAAAMIREGL